MSKDTNETKKDKKVNQATTKRKTSQVKAQDIKKDVSVGKKKKQDIDDKKNHKVEYKSVQNKVIDNIKKFISQIIEMQEKVKRDEKAEKELEKIEKNSKESQDIINNKSQYLLEYYDLPFRYNETVVKILAQTPKRLFVYWDVADKDRQMYLNAFGENFFQDTYPVLLVHNENKNYTSEIVINDFANSWYIDISDSRDEYIIQLGRKFKSDVKPPINVASEYKNIAINNDYLLIAMSNKLEVPNDHILFEECNPYVKYRNVKTKQEEMKDLTSTIFKNKVKSLYSKLYDSEIKGGKFDMLNPSSAGTSSSIAK